MMVTARPVPSTGRLTGVSSADAGSGAARGHTITSYVYGK